MTTTQKNFEAYNDNIKINNNQMTDVLTFREIENGKEKVVYKSRIGETLSAEEDDEEILGYSGMCFVVDDNHLLTVMDDSVCILLDNNFKEIYRFEGINSLSWSQIVGNDYYYINDLKELIKVNLETGESERIEKLGLLFEAKVEGDYIYYINEFQDLCKYNISTGDIQILVEKVGDMTVLADRIYYYCYETNTTYIADLDGNVIKDISEYDCMGPMEMVLINDRVFDIREDKAASMTIDGKDYIEYTIE